MPEPRAELAGGFASRPLLANLLKRELTEFVERHPRSHELHERARNSLFGGVPMPWMMRWAGGFPIYAAEASGARITDVDGHTYVDLCLGDTGAMPGHGPPAVVEAVAAQLGRGITTMLPTGDAGWVGEELARRFGLGRWTFTLTATDANRTALRLAREVTGRRKILVFSYCYHGTVDEAFAVATPGRETRSRPGNVGPAVDPAETTRAIEFNDVPALEGALADGAVACVLAEPAMTNMGIVLPEPGYHEALRELTREAGTLLIIDETHTFSAGPGGCTAAWGLKPDMVTIGKAVGSGVPAGALGVAEEISVRALAHEDADYEDTGGVGGTLAGNALSLAAMRATLEHVLTENAFAHTIPLANRFRQGLEGIFERRSLPWNVTQLGCRAEYRFQPEPARNGGDAHAASAPELERFLHLYALNRGVLLTPFHNMALMSPATSPADVDLHTGLFDAAVAELGG
jgi:glutamate-1-semialdehyde 2,1-aminomutase